MGENETDFDRDTSEAITVLNDIRENSRSTNTFVEQIVERFRGEQLRTSNGISFLDLKNATFLSYLVDLALVALKKCKGESIDGSEVIDRLVEHRTVLEKIRPINHKLKYQIDKLVNIANTGAVNANDPLSLKPKPENLMVDEDDEDEQNDEENEQFDDEEFDFDMENGEEAEDGEEGDGSEGEDKKKKQQKKVKKYVPPKLAAVRYEGDETEAEKKKKLLERAKKRAMSSSVIRELRREYDDAPEEVPTESVGRRKHQKELSERRRYEEEYFTRLNAPKKSLKEDLMTLSSLCDDITRFEDISALDLDNPDSFETHRKRKNSENKNSTKKSSFKRKNKTLKRRK